jgi:hypothetical protein
MGQHNMFRFYVVSGVVRPAAACFTTPDTTKHIVLPHYHIATYEYSHF